MPLRRRHPSEPDFPHGSDTGYRAGCRPKVYDCPGDASGGTCGQAHSVLLAAYRAANPHVWAENSDWPQTVYVQSRLAETMAAASLPAIEAHTGLTWEQIKAAHDRTAKRIDPAVQEPLDHAWSWFVKGSDTRAEGFRHGTSTGYTAMCRCGRCRVAMSRSSARRHAGHIQAGTILHPPGMVEHVLALHAAGGSWKTVGRASGLSVKQLTTIAEGGGVRPKTAARLLNTTVEQVADRAFYTDSAVPFQRLRSLSALGYPLTWVAAEAGVSCKTLHMVAPTGRVRRETAEAIMAVAEKVGDTWASVEVHGIPAGLIKRTKTMARRAGYYTPAHYDDDGRLDWRAIPDHPWSKFDTRCAEMLDRAHAVATRTLPAKTMARLGIVSNPEAVERMSNMLGIGFSFADGVITVRPEHAARRAQVLAQLDAYFAGEADPVWTALSLGLIGKINDTHPEVIAFRAFQDAAQTIAGALFIHGRINALVARHSAPAATFKEAA